MSDADSPMADAKIKSATEFAQDRIRDALDAALDAAPEMDPLEADDEYDGKLRDFLKDILLDIFIWFHGHMTPGYETESIGEAAGMALTQFSREAGILEALRGLGLSEPEIRTILGEGFPEVAERKQ